MCRCSALALACAASLVVLAPPARAAANAWPTEPTLPIAVTTLGPQGMNPATVSDGAGGAYVIWDQTEAGEVDILAQHYLADGTLAPGWPASGLVVCNAAGIQARPVAVGDGAGGFVVAWEDQRTIANGFDVYVQRIAPGGQVAPGWPANGRFLSSNASFDERDLQIATDGGGGAFVAWELTYNPGADYDIYAGRVDGGGNVAFSGPVDAPGGIQFEVAMCADGAGGAFLAWIDALNGRIAAQRLAPGGGSLWVGSHATVATSGTQMFRPRVVPDAAGGAFVAFAQITAFNYAPVWAQRLTSDGATAWPAPTSIGAAFPYPVPPYGDVPLELVADGAGGFYCVYQEAGDGTDGLFVARHAPGGLPAFLWGAGGVEVITETFFSDLPPASMFPPAVQPDGSGGVFVAAVALPDGDIRVGRITASGAFPSGWGPSGTPVGRIGTFPGEPSICVLPGGSVFAAWSSEFGESNSAILANRVDRFGTLGDPSPAIVSVRDVAHDQGGALRVSWAPSHLDSDPNYLVGSYRVWKQVPAAGAASRLARGEAIAASLADAGLAHGALVATPAGATTLYWELAGTQAAQALPGYSMTIATTGDSTATGNPPTHLMVTALHAWANQFWNSAPDSGWSVDNLAPATPAPFTGTYGAGSTALHWTHHPAPDFQAFRLYRGASPDFEPSAGTFVVETTDTGHVDVFATPRHYKLVAVDAHGNVSGAALVSPESSVGVGPPAPAFVLAFAPPSPNPARGACELAFTLPAAASVRMTVHDAQGRLVRVLLSGERPAGVHRVTWPGDNATGRDTGSGLFFARLEVEGRTLTRKLVRAR